MEIKKNFFFVCEKKTQHKRQTKKMSQKQIQNDDIPQQMREPLLSGHVVKYQDGQVYHDARKNNNQLYNSWPFAIVFVENETDVCRALCFVHFHSLCFRVRCGRHHLLGWSGLDNGLIIDVSRLRQFEFDSDTNRVRIGTGFTQGELVQKLADKNLAIPTGEEANVGIAGLILGGGIGILGRLLGVACDSLITMRIVVPSTQQEDVRVLECTDANEHADLLWACRGAGNGNFGVATQFTLQTHKLPSRLLFFSFEFAFDALTKVLDAWQQWAPFVDPHIGSTLEIVCKKIFIRGMFIPIQKQKQESEKQKESEQEADQKESKQIFEELTSPLLSALSDYLLESITYRDSWSGHYTMVNQGPRKKFQRFSGGYAHALLPLTMFEDVVQHFMMNAPDEGCNFWMLAGKMASNNLPSVFAHREKLFYFEAGCEWNNVDNIGACQTWIGEFGLALRPWMSGIYVNVPEGVINNWIAQYYDDTNSKKLRAIKDQYDPQNIFHFEQSIPSSFS